MDRPVAHCRHHCARERIIGLPFRGCRHQYDRAVDGLDPVGNARAGWLELARADHLHPVIPVGVRILEGLRACDKDQWCAPHQISARRKRFRAKSFTDAVERFEHCAVDRFGDDGAERLVAKPPEPTGPWAEAGAERRYRPRFEDRRVRPEGQPGYRRRVGDRGCAPAIGIDDQTVWPHGIDRCADVVHLKDRALTESFERGPYGCAGVWRQPIGHRHRLDPRVDGRAFEP